jgi:dienelactone hydrolase
MITVEPSEYRQNGAVFEGLVAYDPAWVGQRPGILVVHDWMGVGPYVGRRAGQLAALGYVALAADIYGKGVRPSTIEDAALCANKYKADRQLMRSRARAGLEALKGNPHTDKGRTAAMGYCFGGTVVLELARSGAEMAGFVSFHGGLETPTPEDGRQIRGKVLVLHGADDPLVPPGEVLAFEEEMRKGGVDWQMSIYGGAVHAFTKVEAGNDPSTGVAYDEKADKRSFEAMKTFFAEIFG